MVHSQCGTDSQARKVKDDLYKTKKGESIYPHEWKRKMPYDFTGCLAHMDITFSVESLNILGITGHLQQEMQCLPPVPLHSHVWKIALEQLDRRAS